MYFIKRNKNFTLVRILIKNTMGAIIQQLKFYQ